jgi:uncharacterized protein YaeQ
MALGATVYHFAIELSDVDRNTYAALDLRLARHPSESARYLLTRTLAYCLCYEEGITFSKGGLSSSDEPPVSIPDGAGGLKAWIDVGAPSAERLHKASKGAARVRLFTHVERRLLLQEAATRRIHRVEAIEVWPLAPAFLERAEAKLDRNLRLAVTRNDGRLYLGVGGETLETDLICARLLDPEPSA